jgi:hypothetical protein
MELRSVVLQQAANVCDTRALGAVAVTVPACWYLLHNAPDSSHGHDAHGDHGDSHGKAHHDKEVAAESKVEPEEEAESEGEGEDKDSEKAEASDSDDEAKEADTPETSDDEGKEDEKEGDEKEAASESGDKDKVCDIDYSLDSGDADVV